MSHQKESRLKTVQGRFMDECEGEFTTWTVEDICEEFDVYRFASDSTHPVRQGMQRSFSEDSSVQPGEVRDWYLRSVLGLHEDDVRWGEENRRALETILGAFTVLSPLDVAEALAQGEQLVLSEADPDEYDTFQIVYPVDG